MVGLRNYPTLTVGGIRHLFLECLREMEEQQIDIGDEENAERIIEEKTEKLQAWNNPNLNGRQSFRLIENGYEVLLDDYVVYRYEGPNRFAHMATLHLSPIQVEEDGEETFTLLVSDVSILTCGKQIPMWGHRNPNLDGFTD